MSERLRDVFLGAMREFFSPLTRSSREMCAALDVRPAALRELDLRLEREALARKRAVEALARHRALLESQRSDPGFRERFAHHATLRECAKHGIRST